MKLICYPSAPFSLSSPFSLPRASYKPCATGCVQRAEPEKGNAGKASIGICKAESSNLQRLAKTNNFFLQIPISVKKKINLTSSFTFCLSQRSKAEKTVLALKELSYGKWFPVRCIERYSPYNNVLFTALILFYCIGVFFNFLPQWAIAQI